MPADWELICWPSSVRVGRITGRLPKELADEVVQSLLEFFRYTHSMLMAYWWVPLTSVYLCLSVFVKGMGRGMVGAWR